MNLDGNDDANLFWTEVRVRYGETDQMGVVYHANYLIYIEIGRTEFIRDRLGATYRELEHQGIRLPVVEAALNFRSAASYDELLRVGTQLTQVSGVRLRFDYVVRSEADDRLLAEGHTVLACVDENGQPQRIPEDLRQKLVRIERD